ncbi:MAG: hypothetical protein M3Q76_00120 [Acidobacteriota bacterium]|nr:hypothetical protein [Acidobacteriota bacterium]
MSRIFLWSILAISVALLLFGLANFGTTKPLAFIFWSLIAAPAAYKLFGGRG